MGEIVIRVLVVDAHALMRRAIMSVTWVPGLEEVVLKHAEAATQGEALLALASNPHAVIIDPALGSDPLDRRGMAVVWAAKARGIPVLVHTAQRLEDSIQRDLADEKIPMLTKSVDPIVLNDMAVRRALNVDAHVDAPLDALTRIASQLRALPGRLSENVKQLIALVLFAAIADANGNKTAGAESVGEDRHFADRWLIWLPRKPISATRLRAASAISEEPATRSEGGDRSR